MQQAVWHVTWLQVKPDRETMSSSESRQLSMWKEKDEGKEQFSLGEELCVWGMCVSLGWWTDGL